MDDADLGSQLTDPMEPRCLVLPQGAARPQQQQPLADRGLVSPPHLRFLRCSLVWLTFTGRRATPWVRRTSPAEVVATYVHAMLGRLAKRCWRPQLARAIGRGNIAMMNALPPSSPGVARVVGALGGRAGPLQPGVATPPSRSIIGMEGKQPDTANAGSPGAWAVVDNPYAPSPLPKPSSPVTARDVRTDGSSQRANAGATWGLTVPAFQWVSLFQTLGCSPCTSGAILHHESGSTSTKLNNPTSCAGAVGFGQIMPATAKPYMLPGENLNDPATQCRDPQSHCAVITPDAGRNDPARWAVVIYLWSRQCRAASVRRRRGSGIKPRSQHGGAQHVANTAGRQGRLSDP